MKIFHLLAACLLIHTAAAAQQPPNIIFILADDLGYGNLTSYNPSHKVPTPHIDQLAKEGTRFTRFYSGSPVCAPSRCALMTGKHMGHAYIRGNAGQALRPQDTTLAERLRANGYVTGMFGKWGLGEAGTTGAPEHKGFDAFFGYINQTHAHHYYTNRLFEIQNGQSVKVPVDTTAYSDELILQKALGFIRENKNKPFFLYLPLTIPHAELHVPEPYMQRFRNEDGSSKLGPEMPFVQKGKVTYRSQEQPHAAFAGMITKLDDDVARVMALVKELGLDNNTYVFFTSDNGPHREGGADPEFFNSSGPLRGIKRDLYEGGIRVPMIVRAPGKVPADVVRDDIWAFWDVLPTLCRLTGTRTPENIDGLSFTHALTGKRQPVKHPWLYWQFYEKQYYKEAIVQGHWKLVRLKKADQPETVELYDLSSDTGETRNLAATQPAKVKELLAVARQAKTPAENKAFQWPGTE
ncbi:arylsulfatase [Chitinophaga cymbidii]|uniref:N-acetylgalactosamine-6-sulfatase n=1 Tax=Chitinophaga cymbidii TaxID=1096750 RepID=A0A512RLV3_9BACT|nr:arylsulfatase [Chitinophaga cymbidii]GEP96652.1 N-acetylgalactosamine-6-sulfatase [Chitinophaga cymbidii]